MGVSHLLDNENINELFEKALRQMIEKNDYEHLKTVLPDDSQQIILQMNQTSNIVLMLYFYLLKEQLPQKFETPRVHSDDYQELERLVDNIIQKNKAIQAYLNE